MLTKSGPSRRDALLGSSADVTGAIAEASTKSRPPRRAVPRTSADESPADRIAGWREREFLTVKEMSTVSGLSPGTIYNLHHRGLLRLRRVVGRTMAPPGEFVAALRGVEEEWSPERLGTRGASARAARRAATQSTETT
jgi:hypothetical protein